MKEDIQKRWRSSVTWVAIIAQIIIIVNVFNPAISKELEVILNSLLAILVAIGVFNNPTNPKGF